MWVLCATLLLVFANLVHAQNTFSTTTDSFRLEPPKLFLNTNGIISETEERGGISIVRRSELDIVQANEWASSRPTSIQIVRNIPINLTEAEVMYKRKMSYNSQSVERSIERLASLDKLHLDIPVTSLSIHEFINSGYGSMSENLLSGFQRQKLGDFTLLIGHVNKHGNMRFPDGSDIALSKLQGRGTTWLLGCKTFPHLGDTRSRGLRIATDSTITASKATQLVAGTVTSLSESKAMFSSALHYLGKRGAIITTGLFAAWDYDAYSADIFIPENKAVFYNLDPIAEQLEEGYTRNVER